MLSTKDDETVIAVDESSASDAVSGKKDSPSKLRRFCTTYLNRETYVDDWKSLLSEDSFGL